jgi:hypothetical protein
MEGKLEEIRNFFTCQMQETQESIDEVIAALERRQIDTVMKIHDRQMSVYFTLLKILLRCISLHLYPMKLTYTHLLEKTLSPVIFDTLLSEGKGAFHSVSH